jgi:hypothetical protein
MNCTGCKNEGDLRKNKRLGLSYQKYDLRVKSIKNFYDQEVIGIKRVLVGETLH